MNEPQVLRLMLTLLDYDETLAGARSAQDLMATFWLGDKPHQMTRCLKIFLSVAGSLKDAQFSQEGLRDILAGCIEKSQVSAFELNS